MIAVCNPNNPTGRIMTETEMDRIVELASRHNSWLLADEVYRGAERCTDEVAPSFYGRYDRVIAVGSMSKAYGLPGLRIGWLAASSDVLDQMWARHEYIAISATMLANKLAAVAMQPNVREQILARTRAYIRNGYPVFQAWMDEQSGLFSLTPPAASAVAFVKYSLDINSSEFARRLQSEQSVLIVPGDHFDLDQHVRISFGLPQEYLTAGLERIADVTREVSSCSKA